MMMSGITMLTFSKTIGFIMFLQILVMRASAMDITLTDFNTNIHAQIGEVYHITCHAFRCDKPEFTWASLIDKTLGGTVNTWGKSSTLAMKISSESEGTYRCTVSSCDNPPAEKVFKIIPYSFPTEPVLSVSSLIAGKPSRITCTVPDIYPSEMLTARIYLGEKMVEEYVEEPEMDDEAPQVKNITVSHDFILNEEHDGQEIKCLVELTFLDDDKEPIEKHATIIINLPSVPKKPTLTISPTTTAHIGQSVTIECAAAGDEDVKVTLWKVLKDGDMPLLEKAGSYVIQEASPMDAALYKCTAENKNGVSEASESFRVEYPPVETLISASKEEVSEGDMVTLSCSSKGVPAPSFFLYQLLSSGERILLSESPEVTLSSVTSGVYQCEASNSLGTKKDKLELIVRYKPRNTILNITPSLAVKEGDMVSIQCTSEAYPAPTLVLKKRTDTGLITLDAEHGQYYIKHVTWEDQGKYICESSNAVGKEVTEATLTVQVPPKDTRITISPSAVVKEGEPVLIICTSEAFPAPTLSLKVRSEHGAQELASMGGQYQIAHVGVRHSGTYICQSTNSAGEEAVETTLTVHVPPKNTLITIDPSPVMTKGESGYIKCTSEADPAPTLVLKKKTETELIVLEHENGQYNIEHADMEHAGEYICEAINEAGRQMFSIVLTVQAPPKNTHIVIKPSSLVTEGDEVQIQCTSEGFPTPRLALKKKTELGLIDLLGSEDGLYKILSARLQDIGTYICEATNGAGEQTDEAMLNVQTPTRTTTIVTPSEKPIIQSTEAPIITSTEAPIIPSTETPIIQSTEAPIIPSTEAPTIPSTETPIIQSTEAPIIPSTEAPIIPPKVPSRAPKVLTPSQSITATVPVMTGPHIIIQEKHESPKLKYVLPAILGSVFLISSFAIAMLIRSLKKAKEQRSYSLV